MISKLVGLLTKIKNIIFALVQDVNKFSKRNKPKKIKGFHVNFVEGGTVGNVNSHIRVIYLVKIIKLILRECIKNMTSENVPTARFQLKRIKDVNI